MIVNLQKHAPSNHPKKRQKNLKKRLPSSCLFTYPCAYFLEILHQN